MNAAIAYALDKLLPVICDALPMHAHDCQQPRHCSAPVDVHVDQHVLDTASHIHAWSAGLCQTVLTELQKEFINLCHALLFILLRKAQHKQLSRADFHKLETLVLSKVVITQLLRASQ